MTDPVLASVAARLRTSGCVFAEEEAALLVDATATAADLDANVERRVAGTPLEHLLEIGRASCRERVLCVV